MRYALLTMICFLSFGIMEPAQAEVRLFGGTSCYKTPESPNCQTFYAVKSGRPDTLKTGTGDGVAYGSGVTQNKIHSYTFANTFVDGRQPSFEEAELSGTVLVPGTELHLTFYKEASDKINYILISGDVSGTVKYSALAGYDTQVNLTLTVGNPNRSASGDAGAAVGIVIDYSDNATVDFHESVFVTNAHPLDIGPSAGTGTGQEISAPARLLAVADVAIRGQQNSVLDLTGYLSESLLMAFGVDPSDPAAVLSNLIAYRGRIPARSIAVSNTGIIESEDFQFGVPLNTASRIVRLGMSNADWSIRTIGFGISVGAPLAKTDIKGGLSALKRVNGEISDSEGSMSALVDLSASLSAVAGGGTFSKSEMRVLKTAASLLNRTLAKAEASRLSSGNRKVKLLTALGVLKKGVKSALKSVLPLLA